MNNVPLFMIQMQLDIRKIYIQASAVKLLKPGVDEGYYLHQQIAEMFGENVFSSFFLLGQSHGWLNVLGYSQYGANDLKRRAQEFSTPFRYGVCNWDTFSGKPMPSDWPVGQAYRFSVKTCPVVRLSSGNGVFKKGAEVDAYVARVSSSSTPKLTRESVYKKWLEEVFERSSAVRSLQVRLEGFRLSRLLRRSHGERRSAKVIERPEARMNGVLEIADSEKFNEFLRKGVGRHNAFGFGMLLLKPM